MPDFPAKPVIPTLANFHCPIAEDTVHNGPSVFALPLAANFSPRKFLVAGPLPG
jgi:hypothetical protein